MSCHHHCLHRLRRAVRRWLGCPEWRASVLGPNFRFTSLLIDEETTLATTLRDSDPGVLIDLTPKPDARGIAPQAGTIEWTCSDPSVLTIGPRPSGLSCTVTLAIPVKLGTATVTATDTSHPKLPKKSFDFTVEPEELSGYDATITPLLPSADPAEPKATDEHQVVS